MHEAFQDIFVNPTNKSNIKYQGTYKGNEWLDGILAESQNEWSVIDGIPFFNCDYAGDQFLNEEIDQWYQNGWFQNNLKSKQTFALKLIEKATNLRLPVVDIASGPGLGLLPGILVRNKDIEVMATDACSYILKTWHKFFIENHAYKKPSFASFDARNMPLKNDSVDIFTSCLGFSSIRYGGSFGNDRNLAIREAYRVLKKNGHIFTVESRYEDLDAIQEVFRKWGKDCWITYDNERPWSDRFIEEKFDIIDEYVEFKRKLSSDDNDLGLEAYKAGIEINIEFKAYHLQKK